MESCCSHHVGTVMYKVMLENCQKIVRRHVNQLYKGTFNIRHRSMDIGQTEVNTTVPALSNTESTSNAELQNSAFEPEQENSTEPRYPTRNRNRLIHFGPYVSEVKNCYVCYYVIIVIIIQRKC